MENYLIVFDINDTLLMKINKHDKDTLNQLTEDQKKHIEPYNWKLLVKRQHTEILQEFLHNHKIDYIFWSTALRKNTGKMVKYLENIGYTFHLGYLGQEDCEEGEDLGDYNLKKNKKNLKIACEAYNKKLENCILVDNTIKKRVENQNIYCITDMRLGEEDYSLCELVKYLDEFVKCKNECFCKTLK